MRPHQTPTGRGAHHPLPGGRRHGVVPLPSSPFSCWRSVVSTQPDLPRARAPRAHAQQTVCTPRPRQAMAVGRDGSALDGDRDARGRAAVPQDHRLLRRSAAGDRRAG